MTTNKPSLSMAMVAMLVAAAGGRLVQAGEENIEPRDPYDPNEYLRPPSYQPRDRRRDKTPNEDIQGRAQAKRDRRAAKRRRECGHE